MEEIWKDVEGLEGLYKVSNYGELKRIYKNGENIIKGSLKKGLIRVTLKNKDKRLNISLARLVAQTFIRDLKENEIAIHIDGDKLNNRYDNLKILTLKEAGKINGEKSIELIDRNKLEKDFIKKFSLLHGDKWEYVGGYTNSRNSIIIKCKICGSQINIIPDNSLRKTAKLKCNKCEAEKHINNFKIEFNNKYKNKYEYIDRENNQNAFTEDIHIIKCLKCGKINKLKGKTLLYSKFNCKCQIKYTKHTIDYNKLEKKFKERFNELYGNYFEYLDGYTEGVIRYKCKQCGEIKKRKGTSLSITEDNKLRCSKCGNNQTLYEKKCKVCGNIFIGTKRSAYCSDICKKKYQNRQHDLRRRIKNKEQIDNDISLEKLIQRDEGICKTCGRQVDINDYYYNDEGYFIAGESYPSIDHIIPLAKDGTHTWNNIQLAHRHCNAIKNDNIIEQEEEQLKWI